MKCNRHPRYRGAAPSTLKTLCHTCNFIRLVQRLRKAIGLSYALPKPRLIKTPNFAANLAALAALPIPNTAAEVKALGAPWKEPTEAVIADRRLRIPESDAQ